MFSARVTYDQKNKKSLLHSFISLASVYKEICHRSLYKNKLFDERACTMIQLLYYF